MPCDSSNNSGDQHCWSIIKGQAYWGTSGITELNVNTAEECSASCSTTSGCSGATYNPDNNTCILRKGQSSPVVAEGSYAIVPKGKQLLKIIELINIRLTNINNQISNIIDQGKIEYNFQAENRKNYSDELLDNYYKLNEEKENIAMMLNKYKDTGEYLEQGNIKVSQNYYSFLLLLLLAIVIIFFLIKLNLTGGKSNMSTNTFQTGGKLSHSLHYIIFFIFVVVVILTFLVRKNII
jgi:hypothetical protein